MQSCCCGRFGGAAKCFHGRDMVTSSCRSGFPVALPVVKRDKLRPFPTSVKALSLPLLTGDGILKLLLMASGELARKTAYQKVKWTG